MTTPETVRLPPHSVDAEESTLGSVLIDPSLCFDRVRAILGDDGSKFYIVKVGWIYDVFVALRDRGDPIDFLTVCNELEARGQLAEVGGPAYISYLSNVVPTALHAEGYARIVARKKARRDLLGTSSDLAQLAYYESDDSGADFVSQAIERFTKFSSNGHGQNTWHAFTLKDAYAKRPSSKYVVGGLFTMPSLSSVYSAPGRLKSFWLADIAVCVSVGKRCLLPMPGEEDTSRVTYQVPVCWLDFDNGVLRCHERFEALGRAYELPENTPIFYYSMPSPWLDAGDFGAMQRLAQRIIGHSAGLVIVDNLGAVMGKADENSGEMVNIMSNFRRLAEATGAAVVVVHHERKNTGIIGRAGDKLRGHSSIEAALDLALLVEREEHSDLLTIRSTKTRGADVYPFGALFTYEHKPGTTELATARFFGAVIEDTTSNKAIEDAIISALTGVHLQNQTKLIGSVKAILPEVGKNRVALIANGMVKAGKLKSATGTRGAWLYDLP